MATTPQEKRARDEQRAVVRRYEDELKVMVQNGTPEKQIKRHRTLLAKAKLALWSMPGGPSK